MLVLTRKSEQEIVIAENLRVKVLDVRGNQVRLAVCAPKEINIHRNEAPATLARKLTTSFCATQE